MTVSYPIRTERLVIRPLAQADLSTLREYRNDADVSRYQEWPLPVTADDVAMLVEPDPQPTEPVRGHWVQLAITLADDERSPAGLIGDLGLYLDASGSLARVGYTLARSAQGHGYATEAVEAIVDHLIDVLGVVRVDASTDPHNRPSMRVLERVGFVHEHTATDSVVVRGELLDDERWALSADDRRSWRSRPTGPAESVDLVQITPHTQRDVARLRTHHTQETMVAPVSRSFGDALFPESIDGHPVLPWLRAVHADGDLAGFVMVADVTEHHPEPYLWRLLIDRRHQGRGIGRAVIAELVDRYRPMAAALLTSYVDEPGGPGPFYAGLGFVPTGEIVDEEVETRLRL